MDEENKIEEKKNNKAATIVANIVSYTLTGCLAAIAVALTVKLIMLII